MFPDRVPGVAVHWRLVAHWLGDEWGLVLADEGVALQGYLHC